MNYFQEIRRSCLQCYITLGNKMIEHREIYSGENRSLKIVLLLLRRYTLLFCYGTRGAKVEYRGHVNLMLNALYRRQQRRYGIITFLYLLVIKCYRKLLHITNFNWCQICYWILVVWHCDCCPNFVLHCILVIPRRKQQDIN